MRKSITFDKNAQDSLPDDIKEKMKRDRAEAESKEEDYVPFGDEWAKEIMKHEKSFIVDMYQKAMQHKNIIPSGSLEGAENYMLGLVNDFEGGIIGKAEFMKSTGSYTMRLMDIFWRSAQQMFKKFNLNHIISKSGRPIVIGDQVRILRICDDSGMACDLYGVEPQLNGFVEILYVEDFEGCVEFDLDRLMIVVNNGKTKIPLSSQIRYDMYDNVFDRLNEIEDLTENELIVKYYPLDEINRVVELDVMMNYIEVINENE